MSLSRDSKRSGLIFPAPVEYVGVCDQRLDAHLLHLGWFYNLEMRVYDRQEEWSPDRPVSCREAANPPGDVTVEHFESDGHGNSP